MPPHLVSRSKEAQCASASASKHTKVLATGSRANRHAFDENDDEDGDANSTGSTSEVTATTGAWGKHRPSYNKEEDSDDSDEGREMALKSPIKPAVFANVESGPKRSKAAGASSASSANGGDFGVKKANRAIRNQQVASSSSSTKSRGRLVLRTVGSANNMLASDEERAAPKKRGRLPKKAAAKSSTRRLKQARQATGDRNDYVAEGSDTGPHQNIITRSAEGVPMPEDQIQTFLDGFDLEASNRLSRIRSHLAVTLDSARSQMTILLSRLPPAARNLPLQDFIDLYAAEVKTMVQRVGRQASGADGWEEMKKKRVRDQEAAVEEGSTKRKGTAVKRNDAKANAATPFKAAAASGNAASGRPKAGLSHKTAKVAIFVPVNSVKPPTAPTFSPSIPLPAQSVSAAITDASETQKPVRAALQPKSGRPSRLAKIGEMVQMLSLNGSPITGIIGPDGRFRHLTSGIDGQADRNAGVQGADPEKIPILTSNATATAMRQMIPSGTATLRPPSSPASTSRAAFRFRSSSIAFDDDDDDAVPRRANAAQQSALGRPSSDDSGDDLPDEQTEMRRFMEEEQARRRASKLLSAKMSVPKLRQAFGHYSSSSSAGAGGSSQPPSSSPLRGSAATLPSSATRPLSRMGSQWSSSLRSSSPSKNVSPSSKAQPLAHVARLAASKPSSSGTGSVSTHGVTSGHLSFVNASGETIDLANVKDEDISQDQKMNLFGLFSRWKRDVGTPKKK